MAESAKYESGASLLEALQSGEMASLGSQDVFVGMVKASESEGNVAFTSGSCDEWVDLPADLVGDVEVLGQGQCRGHSHPRVRMQLKLDENDPMHGIVRKLMKVGSARASRPWFGRGRFGRGAWGFGGLRPPRLGGEGGDDYWVDCTSVCAGDTMWCVCWASDGESWSYPCGSC